MDNKTQERIKADAEAYVQRTRGQQGRVETYIAGATAVHDRAQVLVDALETIAANSEHPGIKSFAAKALEQWKGKEVEDGIH